MLAVVNHFIENYRICSQEFYIPLVKDLPFRSFCSVTNVTKGLGQVIFQAQIETAKLNIEERQHKYFKETLLSNNALPSHTLSLNSAKYWLANSNFRSSVLEAIIALEPMVEKAVTKLWSSRNISNTKIKEQLRKIDLHYKFVVEIPNVIDLDNEEIKLHYDKVVNSINIRNKIVHQNYDELIQNDVKEAVVSVEFIMNLLNNI